MPNPRLFKVLTQAVGLALTLTTMVCSPSASAMDLMQAYNLALQNDRQLRAAVAAYDAGLEALPQAQSRLYPSLGLSSTRLFVTQERKDADTQYPTQRYPSQSDTLSLRQPLYNPRLFALKDQASASVASATANLQGEQQNLAVRLTEAYLNVWLARERSLLVNTQLKSTDARLLAAQKSFASGIGIRTDIDEIQAQLDVLQAQALQARQKILSTSSELETLTAQPISHFYGLDKHSFRTQTLEPGQLDLWLTNALARNNEVRYRASQLVALKASLESVHAEDLPSVDALAQLSRNSGENAYFVNSRTQNQTLGVQISMPLYQGGWFSSRQRQALANLREGQEMLQRAELMVQNDVRKTYYALKEGLARVEALEKANASAQLVVTANQKSFQAGVRTTLDILAAQQRVVQVGVDLAEARAQCLNAWVRLKALVDEANEASMQSLSAQFKSY